MSDFRLILKFKGRVIAIPFKKIENLDAFTVNYDNKKELAEAIKRILGININGMVYDVYIQQVINDKKLSILPVKYSSDDFDIDDLVNVYKQYYKDDHMRIKTTDGGIKFVKHDTINNFLHNVRDVTNMDIDKAVNSFFKGNYRKYRDAYFTVKSYGYIVRLNSQKSIDISDYHNEDEYFQFLQRIASLSDEKRDRVIEELSLYDLEDLEKMIPGFFDGTKGKKTINIDEERQALSLLSGIGIDELEERFGNRRGIR